MAWCAQRSEDSLRELVLFFYHVSQRLNEFSLSGLVASALAVPSLDFLSILSSACLICVCVKQ